MTLSDLGKTPISAESPAGSDARYDPLFEELQTEVEKLSALAVAGTIDWEKTARLAAEILECRSKDLLAASYLAVSLIHVRSGNGFDLGLQIYRDLIERFWEELYPQKSRMRGRLRALEWWTEKTEAALKLSPELSFAPEQVSRIEENLDKLDRFLREKLESPPALAALVEQFRLCAAALEPGESASEAQTRHKDPEAPGAVPASESATTPQAEPQRPATVSDKPASGLKNEPMVTLNDGLLAVSQASFQLWQQEPGSPLPYRLARQVAWYAVNELPPATDGVTRIPPPSSQEKKLLQGLREKGDAEALLKGAEPRQAQYIFWFDLSRLVAEALDYLGPGFHSASESVCQETAFLLYRLPGLETLSFSDGTPFASQETRNWLKRCSVRSTRPELVAHSATSSGPAHEAGAEAVIERKIAEIQDLVKNGKLIEAMEVVQQKLRSCSSRRENLLWRLSLSQMLVDLGQSRLALPHLEQVLHDIAGHGLEQYDPSLALRGLKLAWLAFDAQSEQKFKDQAQDVLHQIARFDMPEMVRLTHA